MTDAIRNRTLGYKAGVAGIYNRALYAAEKRQALELWAEHVRALVQGSEPKVVSLRPRESGLERDDTRCA